MKVKSLLHRMKKARVLVIGDLILDQYIRGEVERISPEAPVPVLDVTDEYYVLGGALNVVNNIYELGATVYPCGIVGQDKIADTLRSILDDKGIPIEGVVHDGKERPTTLKTRIVSGNQQIVRIDKEVRYSITMYERIKLIAYVRHVINDVDVIVLEDYGKGVVSKTLIKKIADIVKEHKKIFIVDPKNDYYRYYRGVDLITPNLKEAIKATGMTNNVKFTDTFDVATKLLKLSHAKNALITEGKGGMSLLNSYGEFIHEESEAKEVFDVSGAGDTVVAAIAVCLAIGMSLREAINIANVAAGIVVGKKETLPITQKELEIELRRRNQK